MRTEVADARGGEDRVTGGMGGDIGIRVPLEPRAPRPQQPGEPELATGVRGIRMDIGADADSGSALMPPIQSRAGSAAVRGAGLEDRQISLGVLTMQVLLIEDDADRLLDGQLIARGRPAVVRPEG